MTSGSADDLGAAGEPGAAWDDQAHLDRAYRCLAAMSERTSAAADDAASRAAGDWDATVAHRHLVRRGASMATDLGPLCFGRIDEEAGPVWHIGRRHVEDEGGKPVVVDWRAPVAVPFYRATFADPLGLRRRRRFILDGPRLADVLDEDFDDPASASNLAGSGLPDPLLAELGRARAATMHDIVATIAAEQDRIIRAPLDVPVVVQGGPGTGKTAVGLHRAAFLLYEHRQRLQSQGVLVLGPNRLFLAYISEVLPSLGEVAVVQTTLSGLVPGWRVRGRDEPRAAALKGDPRLAEVIAAAARSLVRAPAAPLRATTRWGTVTLAPPQVASWLEEALASGGASAQQRMRFRAAVTRAVTAELGERRGVVDRDEVAADLGRDRPLQAVLQRIWPARSAAALVRSLYGGPAAFGSRLDRDEQALLRRTPARSLAEEGWTEADLPLLDEADAVLSGPPRRYGHVVVDEAQDLSPMALRMVARRCAERRSLTVLGDLAQATAPGAARSWLTALHALGDPPGADVAELTTGYRVPAQIMDLANRVLAASDADLPATRSVRRTDDVPQLVRADAGELESVAASPATELFARHASTAVIARDHRIEEIRRCLASSETPVQRPGQVVGVEQVSLLRPEEAKGLEFDAVVVTEPAELLDAGGGVGLLFIALTRAVQHLTLVHSAPLPSAVEAQPSVRSTTS